MSDSLFTELQTLKKQKKKWQTKNNLQELSRTCNAIGELFAQQGKYHDALDEHEEELEICTNIRDVLGCAVANRKIGECYNELGDYEQALCYVNKYLELARSSGNVIEEQRALATIGRTHLCQAESLEQNSKGVHLQSLANAENAFVESLDICKSLSNEISKRELMEMKGRLYLNLGLIHDYKGNLIKCADLIKQAIHVNEMYDLREDLHRCQYSLASIYYRSGSSSQALRITDEAYSTASKLKDVILQCETLLLKAKILLRINDFGGAKYYLKKSFRLKTPNEIIRDEIKQLLKVAIKLCKLDSELNTLTDDDLTDRMKLYEELGDNCAKIECYNLCVDYYNKMLECAEKLLMNETEKAPIYFSLAETYVDLGKYELAMENYKKELLCRKGNSREECKTWLNIIECQLKQGTTFSEIEDSCINSLDCAQKAEDGKLQESCLKSLIKVQEEFNEIDAKITTEEELEQLRDKYDLSSQSEFENSQRSIASSASELSDFSDSNSDESQNEEYDRPRKPRGPSRLSTKKNEKGETPLHRACISGNLSQVRRLIEKGHHINPRDNCGWIPLHEAANHDHVEIVEYLLTKGAWVNDRGGIHCDGISPLHDAASCGNMEVMQLLIDHGASVIAKTNHGDTALECLNKWRKRAGEDLDSEVLQQYSAMVKKIKEKMESMGQTLLSSNSRVHVEESKPTEALRNMEEVVSWESEDEEEDIYRQPVARIQRKRPSAELSPHEELLGSFLDQNKTRKIDHESSIAVDNDEISGDYNYTPAAEVDMDDGERARQEYTNAIASFRSAAWRMAREKSPVQTRTEEKRALVNEDEIVIDDWLEEDVIAREKCKQAKTSTFRPRKTRMRQLKLHVTKPIADTSANVVDTVEISDEENHFPLNEPNEKLDCQQRLDFISDVLRVKVRIQEKLFLIPIPQSDLNQTINWLAEAASTRYHRVFGIKPVLTLCTTDGAVLAFDDQIAHVVNGNDELIGSLERWELPPLSDRYVAACESVSTAPFSNIKHILDMANISHNLDMIDLGLKTSHAQIILRAVQCQYALRHLNLSGNSLGNNGLKTLCDTLTTLPNLLSLNVSCNNISSLQPLVDALASKGNNNANGGSNIAQKPLQLLTDLYLNFNPLGDESSSCLAGIISNLPLLSRLEMSSCSLSKTFLNSRSPLSTALAGALNLRRLNISYNRFDVDVFDALLKSLHANQMTILDCGSSGNYSRGVDKLTNCLRSYFTTNNCALEELNMKDCHLSDEAVSQIALCIAGLTHLCHLSLANNIELSEASLIALTNSLLQNKQLQLQFLDFSGCPKIIARLNSPILKKVLEFWDRKEQIHGSYQLKLKWVCR